MKGERSEGVCGPDRGSRSSALSSERPRDGVPSVMPAMMGEEREETLAW
jgi:hypothetical protein